MQKNRILLLRYYFHYLKTTKDTLLTSHFSVELKFCVHLKMKKIEECY